MGEPTRILCVDGEQGFLRSLEGFFRDAGYEIRTALTCAEGLSLLSGAGPAQVVLSGTPGPAADGVEFLREVRARWPDTVRIGVTEGAEAGSAGSAVQEGEVYKLLPRTCDGEEARAIVENGLARFRLVRALRGADDATLLSIAQEVELRDRYTDGHCERVAASAVKLASALGLPGEATRSIRYAGWLHDCGKIGVPEEILNHPGKLSPAQFAVVRNHSVWGAEVARLARLPEEVAEILLRHHERFDGRGYPAGMKGQEIPLAARIVAATDVFDAVTMDRPYARGYDREEAIRVMGVLRGASLDPEIVDALFAAL